MVSFNAKSSLYIDEINKSFSLNENLNLEKKNDNVKFKEIYFY